MAEREKNPYAVALGERIKQSRRMAGLDNVERLLELMPDWGDKRSRLTNYEAGISMAPLEAIIDIARATGCSECWLMFGSGPIRSTGCDLQAIRHQNFVYVVGQAKESKRSECLFGSLGISPVTVEEMIANPFIPITDRIARRSERFLKKPVTWLDKQHIENEPVFQSYPDDTRELMSLFSELPTTGRAMILEIARTIRSHSLRPLWNGAASSAVSQRDWLRYDGAVAEPLSLKQQNALLRKEVQNLREQLALATNLGVSLPGDTSNQRRAKKRTRR